MVIGVNGSLPINFSITVRWNINNDYGKQHASNIPNTLYVPGMNNSIMSPQPWVLQMELASNQSAWEETTRQDSMTLF